MFKRPADWRGAADPRWDAAAAALEGRVRTLASELGEVHIHGGNAVAAVEQARKWRAVMLSELDCLGDWFAGGRQAKRYLALQALLSDGGDLQVAIQHTVTIND